MANYASASIGANDSTDGLTPEQREEVKQFQKRNVSHGEVGPDGDASNRMTATVNNDGEIVEVEQHVTERGSSIPATNGPVILDRTYNSPISIDQASSSDLIDLPGYGKMELGIALSQGLVTKAELEGSPGRTAAPTNSNRPPPAPVNPYDSLKVNYDPAAAEAEAAARQAEQEGGEDTDQPLHPDLVREGTASR